MQNIGLLLEYDGSRYSGWSRKSNKKKNLSIQEKLESVLTKMEGTPVSVTGAVRTEAGVHAYGQTAHFKIASERDPEEIQMECNRYLPKDIAVLKAFRAPERFHSVFSAKSVCYQYRILEEGASSVWERNYAHLVSKKPDCGKIREAAECLTGTHDFRAFSDNPKMKKGTVRRMDGLWLQESQEELRITIKCDDFWPGMARNLVGLLLEAGSGLLDPQQAAAILNNREPGKIRIAGEPCALYLLGVSYVGNTEKEGGSDDNMGLPYL